MPKRTTTAAETTAITTTQPETALAVARQVLETIPQVDEDPTERMATFIFAQPPERWEELWAGLPSIRDLVGEVLTVHAVRARESDFEGPLGLYLILDVTLPGIETHDLVSCSSQMSIIQLLALVKGDRLPAKVQVVAKDKPTKRGFRPIHLRYLDKVSAPLGDPGAVVSEQ